MKRLRTTALAVLVLLSASFADDKAKPEKLTLNFEGKARTYYVFVPSGLSKSAPMLLLLHGSGRNGMSLIDPWRDFAAKEGVILVAPDSSDSSHWDQAADGPDFIHAVAEEAKSKYPVDPRRVYVFGHSAGAVYALYLSVIQSEYFAATAIHAGFLLPGDFRIIDIAARKIPIAIWVGTNDPYFSLASVHATRDAFNSRGFSVQLNEIPSHNHDYYSIAAKINPAIWEFLKANALASDPVYREYRK
jgi:poly(3-hydroxybutyrate) depolymerase